MSMQTTHLRSWLCIALLLSVDIHRLSARRIKSSVQLDVVDGGEEMQRNATSIAPFLYGLSAASGLYFPATAPAVVAAAGGINWLGVGIVATASGFGGFVKPLVGGFIANRATQTAVQTTVVAATRTNMIGMALSKVAPWAFAAGAVTPAGQGVIWLANIALTGWQLFSLTKSLKSNPGKLCGLLKAMPGNPLADKCIPGGPWNKIPPVPEKALVPDSWRKIVPPKIALAVIAAIVVAAGGYLLYKHVRMNAFNEAFCPKTDWDIDKRFYGEIPGANATASGPHLPGMAHCKGYSRKIVQVYCAPDDISCRHAACQTACCSTENCIAYQFNNQAPWFAYMRPLVCYLTYKDVTKDRCEAPWFGEERSNYDPGVDEPMWSMAGIWYPPDYETREETWGPSPLLSQQMYGLTSVSPPSLDNLPACHPAPNSPTAMEQCEKEQCRLACLMESHCLFYQYQRKSIKEAHLEEPPVVPSGWKGVEKCYLGFAKNLETWSNWGKRMFPGLWKGDYDEEEVWANAMKWSSLMNFQAKEWHGGERTTKDIGSKGCPASEYGCPSSRECVKDCKECEGFHLEGDGSVCERAAEQAICDASQWIDTYSGEELNKLKCYGLNYKGLQQEVVRLSEPSMMSAHDICRSACCDMPRCVMYQFDKKLGDKTNFKEGESVTCNLFMVGADENPMFKCDQGESSIGGYLQARGCPLKQYACLETNGCVNTCGNGNCLGAPFDDDSTSSCVPNDPDSAIAQEAQLEMESAYQITDVEWPECPLKQYACLATKDCVNTCDGKCPGAPFDDDSTSTCVTNDPDNEDDILENAPITLESTTVDVEDTAYTVEDAKRCDDPPCIELADELAESETYYLVPDTPHESAFETTFSGIAAETVLKLEAMPLLPREQRANVCSLLTVGAYACGVMEDFSGCSCTFRKPLQCSPTFFHSGRHLRVITMEAGKIMFAGDGCECHEEETADQFYTCDFKVMRRKF